MKLFKALAVIFFITNPAFAAEEGNKDADLVYTSQFGSGADINNLVGNGANPNAMDKQGTPAIIIAARRTDGEGQNVLQSLLSKGANIDQQDPEGKTALYHAASIGNMENVKILMEKGANPYLQDKHADYPRNVAFQNNYPEVAKYMDGFVEKQRQERLAQYDAYNKAVQQQYDQVKNQINQANGITETSLSAEEAKAMQQALKKQQEEEAKNKAEEIQKVYKTEAFRNDIRALSQQACLFEYWTYVDQVGVKTEIAKDSLSTLTRQYKEGTSALQESLKEKYMLNDKYLGNIIKIGQQEIYEQLANYGSNATLASNNVGKRSDADKRCTNLSNNLDFGGISFYAEEPKRNNTSTSPTPSAQQNMQPKNMFSPKQ